MTVAGLFDLFPSVQRFERTDRSGAAMFHLLEERNPNRSKHWWIRLGTSDTDTALTVAANLATAADNLGDDVDHTYYWDKGHATNEDPGDFIKWVARVTGHKS